MPFFDNTESRHVAWDLSQTNGKNVILQQKDGPSKKEHGGNDWTNDAASISSSSSWTSSSSSGRSFEPQNDQRCGPVICPDRTDNIHNWGRPRTNHCEGDSTPRFSGMSYGDVMRITVMKEMDKLNMNYNKAMDLSCKPWNIK